LLARQYVVGDLLSSIRLLKRQHDDDDNRQDDDRGWDYDRPIENGFNLSPEND
jgi:hypothetical protein